MARFLSRYQSLCLTIQDKGVEVATVKFQDGQYETSDKKVASALKKHPDFGSTIFEDKAAVEPPKEPAE